MYPKSGSPATIPLITSSSSALRRCAEFDVPVSGILGGGVCALGGCRVSGSDGAGFSNMEKGSDGSSVDVGTAAGPVEAPDGLGAESKMEKSAVDQGSDGGGAL